jgi:putative oxidoreductase
VLTNFQNALALTARFLMALLFLPEGISKIGDFAGITSYIGSAALPLPALAAVIAIVVEVVGSAALLAGLQTRWVALVMCVFTLATAFFFHRFWTVSADQVTLQHIMFFKNLAIAGGLLMLAAFGAGVWSMDARHGT